jgi:predicted DNA binding protein
VKSILDENLTDRQRAALEAGYYGGFFEWPRDRSGEEVAQSLDIGASTFHQHLRKAEKALLDSVFD